MTQSNPYFINFTANANATCRLFCFPYAGTGASIFTKWKKYLPASTELWGVQIPGRETRWREPAIRDFKQLTTQLLTAIQPYLDKPCVFFGYSAGALMAHQLALQLQEQNLGTLHHLIIAACRPPEEMARDVSLIEAARDPHATIQKMQFYNGTSELVFTTPEIRDIYIPILQADFALLASYQIAPHSPLQCPMVVLYGNEEPDNSLAQAQMWQQYTQNSFAVFGIAGGHFFINQSLEKVVEIVGAICSQTSST